MGILKRHKKFKGFSIVDLKGHEKFKGFSIVDLKGHKKFKEFSIVDLNGCKEATIENSVVSLKRHEKRKI